MKAKRKSVKGSVSKQTTQQQGDAVASSSSSSLEISESLLISSSTSDEDATSRSTSRGDSLDSNRPLMRPPISYAMLITEAIQNSDDKRLILNDIYDYIVTHYPYFKTASSGWKNSIRHNLSLNKAFSKVPRSQRARGKGSYWKLADSTSLKTRAEIDSALRRHSFPGFIGRCPIPLYPVIDSRRGRSGSEPYSKFPVIRPRPQADHPLLGTAHPPPSFPMEIYGQPKMESTVLWPSEAIGTEQTSYFGSFFDGPALDAQAQTPQDFMGILNSQPNSSLQAFDHTFHQDVWLGAGTPKQLGNDRTPSLSGVSLSIPTVEANEKPRTPPSSIFDSNQSLIMPFAGYI